MMHGKKAVYVFIVVIIAIFAYYYSTLPQSSSPEINSPDDLAELLEGVTLYKTVTGTIVGMNKEVIMLSTSEGVLRLKKMEATRYLVLYGGISTPVGERDFQKNEQATVVAGVDETANEITALSVTVNRQ